MESGPKSIAFYRPIDQLILPGEYLVTELPQLCRSSFRGYVTCFAPADYRHHKFQVIPFPPPSALRINDF